MTPTAAAIAAAAAPPVLKIKVTLATDPGPAYGLAVAPAGWWWVGKWAVAPAGNSQGVPAGSYFSQADLNSDGTVTLHTPDAGWETTDLGKNLLAQLAAAPGPPVIVPPPPAPPVAAAPWTFPGRTLAQAQAAGDLWGVSVDPATRS